VTPTRLGARAAVECWSVMHPRIFDILRRAGAFRLALIYYAAVIPAFPLVVFVMAGLKVERARELFVVWSGGALAMLLTPIALAMFFWLMAWVALWIERRRRSDAAKPSTGPGPRRSS
jgi:hypothetical protein